jgi:hypothetical protein
MAAMEADVTAWTAQAAGPDPQDRADAAFGLAVAATGGTDDTAVAALIRLTRDAEPDVREQAVFALGALATVDGPAVREALADRLDDPERDVAAEAVFGLAVRRDPRAVSPLAGLLDAGSGEQGPRLYTLQAAAVLGHEALLPALRRYEASTPRVAEAVAEAVAACDPRRRERCDRCAEVLLAELHRLLPGTDAAVSAHRMESEPVLTVTVAGAPWAWNVDRLLERAGGDALRAAQLVVEDVRAKG